MLGRRARIEECNALSQFDRPVGLRVIEFRVQESLESDRVVQQVADGQRMDTTLRKVILNPVLPLGHHTFHGKRLEVPLHLDDLLHGWAIPPSD